MECVASAKAKRGEPLKTKEDLKALVPVDETIPKLALIQRASMNGFGLNHAKRLLADLVAEKELFEVRRSRPDHPTRTHLDSMNISETRTQFEICRASPLGRKAGRQWRPIRALSVRRCACVSLTRASQ